jgi:APA family basic amino acid/polyamine antiporter
LPAFRGAAARAGVLALVYSALLVVNVRGARGGARLSTALAVIKLAPLIVLIAAGAFVVRESNLIWPAAPAPSKIGETAVLVFFAFMGVEGALTASGEVVKPERTVPRAILFALTLVAILYISLQVVAQGVLGGELANAPAPLVATATAVFGPWGTTLLVAATLLSVSGFLSADILCSPRNLYAMAERGQLPHVLASVHPRFNTPAVAVTTYTIICALVAWSGSFRQLVVVSTSGSLLLYLICCLGVFPLRRRNVTAAGAPFVAADQLCHWPPQRSFSGCCRRSRGRNWLRPARWSPCRASSMG